MEHDILLYVWMDFMEFSQVGLKQKGKVSVIIPTRNRIQECIDLFAALNDAVEFVGGCEVIVIDDSTPDNSAQIKRLCNSYGFSFIYTYIHSVAQKRNMGWTAAKGDIVIFLDSDCLPEKDLIAKHLETYAESENIGCLGDLSFVGERSIFFRATEYTPFAKPFQFARRFESTTWGPTANISFRRSELERVGGFDSSFPERPGGEDVDIGLRITQNSSPIVCNPSARVGHSTSTWNAFNINIKRFFGWGRADYHLIIRHPQKVTTDLPRIPLTFTLLLASSVLLSVVKDTFYYLSVPFVWLIFTMWISAILFYCESGKPTFIERLIALSYLLANEIGTLYEGLSKKYWPIVIKRMNYGSGQIYGEWHEGGRRLWAQWIALIICYCLY